MRWLFVFLIACGDDCPTMPDASPDSSLFKSCKEPWTEQDKCEEVCCEGEDWWTDDTGQRFCMNTKRLCT